MMTESDVINLILRYGGTAPQAPPLAPPAPSVPSTPPPAALPAFAIESRSPRHAIEAAVGGEGLDTVAQQWCDDTVNSTSGCDGCELKVSGRDGSCYAVPIHQGRLARSFPELYSPDFHEIRLIPGRMAKAAARSDLRGKDRPDKPWLNGLP